MRPRALGVLIALSVPAVVVLAGCGSGLSAVQVRNRATQACDRAADRSAAIRLPEAPSGGKPFLAAGIAVLAPEIRALARLGDHGSLHAAVSAMQAEVRALRSALKGVRAGDDPVVAIMTLQQQLVGPERRANTAWRLLRVPACVNRG